MHGIFLDRDGVINRERADYVKSWEEFEFLPSVRHAFKLLAGFNIPTFIITNQSAVGRNIVELAEIDAIHQRMITQIQACGLEITQIYICPHHPNDRCGCRKPEPGMLISAAADHELELSHCYFIGDSITDYQAAARCGCQPILVRSGRQGSILQTLLAKQKTDGFKDADANVPIVEDLLAAVMLLEDSIKMSM